MTEVSFFVCVWVKYFFNLGRLTDEQCVLTRLAYCWAKAN